MRLLSPKVKTFYLHLSNKPLLEPVMNICGIYFAVTQMIRIPKWFINSQTPTRYSDVIACSVGPIPARYWHILACFKYAISYMFTRNL